MSYYCHGCDRIIEEDDKTLCPNCERNPMPDPIKLPENRDAFLARAFAEPDGVVSAGDPTPTPPATDEQGDALVTNLRDLAATLNTEDFVAYDPRDAKTCAIAANEIVSLRSRLAEAEQERDAAKRVANEAVMQIADQRATIERLTREREEHAKIIAALPKTKDGAPVYPGMTVWYPWSHDGFAGPHSFTVRDRAISVYEFEAEASMFYATEAAALASKTEAKE